MKKELLVIIAVVFVVAIIAVAYAAHSTTKTTTTDSKGASTGIVQDILGSPALAAIFG
jgi:uncharacterized protein (UPF0333 family)